jgi:hypothetical protein
VRLILASHSCVIRLTELKCLSRHHARVPGGKPGTWFELNQSEQMQMKAIDSLTVGARWLEQELETLLFAAAAALVIVGTVAVCLSVAPHWV